MLTTVPPAGDEAYFAALRRAEFARLDRRGEAYLDYTGAGLYAASQVRAHAAWLERDTFGNPHAEHGASRRSTAVVERAKRRVFEFLDADGREYDVCFTANATGAIKLVAESYPFGRGCALVLSADNHNSVNGVREYARRAGAPVRYVPLDAQLRLIDASRHLDAAAADGGLFAFPAQSNFSGVRHPLTLVDAAHERRFDVLLDAAASAPTMRLSLRQTPADFVVLSFYKIFGYPTGVGALVGRREALARLTRPWFAGGTVEYASVAAFTHRLRPSLHGFEDGTPSFLALAALAPGFAFLERVGRDRVSRRVLHLTAAALSHLSALRHDDGSPMARVYGPMSPEERGGTIAFNVMDRNGPRSALR
jgi:selenocysteine lyase/cysteine desulfurase